MNRSDSTGVGEGYGVPLEILSCQLVCSSTRDDIFVRDEEVGKRHLFGFFDARHEECASPVRLGDVDCQPKVDVSGDDERRSAVGFVVKHVLRGE